MTSSPSTASALPNEATESKRVVYLQSRRFQRALLLQGIQHGLAGAILAEAGVELIQETETLSKLLGAFEIAAGVALFVALVREIKSKAPPGHHGINWVDIFAGAVLFGEGLHRLHDGIRHLPIALSYAAIAVIMLARAVFLPRLLRRRRVELDSERLFIRRRKFGAKEFAWRDIERLRIGTSSIQLEARGGVAHSIDLADYLNADEIREAVREFATLHASAALAVGADVTNLDSARPSSKTLP